MKKRQRKSYIDTYFKELKLTERSNIFKYKVSPSGLITNYYSIIKLTDSEGLDPLSSVASQSLTTIYERMCDFYEIHTHLNIDDILNAKMDRFPLENGYAIDMKLLRQIINIIKPTDIFIMSSSSKSPSMIIKVVNNDTDEDAFLMPLIMSKKDKKE